jgi:iron complex outermembrane receptor protein
MAVFRSPRLLLVTLLFAFTSLAAWADGRISGKVTRSDGSPLPGVVVQAIGTGKATLTDSTGVFLLEGVPAGRYDLSFTAGEHAAQEGVTVTDGETTRVDKQVDWRISIAETITVTSASRYTERVVEAPAAVTVIPVEDIQALAPTGQAPKVVENAPGVDFTQSGLYDMNFNVRGFNTTLNRRILTLIDGRDPSVPFLGSQEWAALSVPIDEFQSVELIRGPGSALYGANAYSGVLNMTTRLPRNSAGGRLMITAGELNTKRADFRHAGGFGSEWYYRVVGGYQNSEDFARSRRDTLEYSVFCAQSGQTDCLSREAVPLPTDDVETKFAGLRLDKHFQTGSLLTLEGGWGSVEGPIFVTGIGRVMVTDATRPWARINYNMRHWNFLGYYDARNADDQRALSSGAGLYEDSSNLHGEVQTNWDFMNGKTRVVGGVAYNQQEVDTANPTGVQTLMLEAKSEDQQSVFGQVDLEPASRIRLVVAARYDDSTLHEAQFSPKGAIVFSVTPHHTLRYGYNEAFQRPNYSELFLAAPAGAPVNLAAAAAGNPASAPLAPLLTQLGFNSMAVLARGNSNLDVEQVKSHEIGYQGIFGGKLYLTVDYYRSNMTDFVTDLLPGVNPAFAPYAIPSTVPAPFVPGLTAFLQAALGPRRGGLTTVDGRPALVFSYANAGEVDTEGAEIAANFYLTNNWLLDLNYSWFDFEVKPGSAATGDQLLPNAPDQKWNAGLAYRGPRFDGKIAYRTVDAFRWAAGVFVGNVPSYSVLNLSGRYRINDMFGVGFDVANALDDEHWEAFGGDMLHRRALGYVSVNW